MATPSMPVQDTPRVEVDLIHAAAAVWLGLDAEDALRALVLLLGARNLVAAGAIRDPFFRLPRVKGTFVRPDR